MTASEGIDYEVVRRPRRLRPAICVSPDLTVKVLLPAPAPESVAHDLIRAKADWVRRKLADFRARARPERRWVDGETLPWLGREFPLRVRAGAEDAACLAEDAWDIHLAMAPASIPALPDGERRLRIVRALRCAVMTMARAELLRRADRLAGRMGLTPASVDIKSYRSRWGSCHADGRIYFNWRIAMAPEFVVDYVVTHELAHLRHRNHSPAFRALVARWMPDWKTARGWLRDHGQDLAVLDDVDGACRRRP